MSFGTPITVCVLKTVPGINSKNGNSGSVQPMHGIPARVVLYRMPIQSRSRTKLDMQLIIRDELVGRIGELYGRRPEEIDPDWGL